MTSSAPDLLEERLRSTLAAAATTTPVDDRPFAEITPRTAPRRRPTRRTLVAAGCTAAVAAVLVAALAARTVGDGDLRTAATIDVGGDPLGPLPHLVVDGVRWTMASASTGPLPLPEAEAGWWVQVLASLDRSSIVELLSVNEDPHRMAAFEDNVSGPDSGAVDVQVQGSPARLRRLGDAIQLWWAGPGLRPVWITARGLAEAEVLAIADTLSPRADRPGWEVGTGPLVGGLETWVDGARDEVQVSRPQWRFEAWFQGDGRYVQLNVDDTADLFLAETLANLSGTVERIEVLGHRGWLEQAGDQVRILWEQEPGILASLNLPQHSRDEALAVARAVREVTPSEWVASLPDDVLGVGEQAALVDELAPGTPLPDGVTLGALIRTPGVVSRGGGGQLTVTPRGHLVYGLATSSQCAWARSWATATSAGDEAAASSAVAALEAAESWSVVERVDELGLDPDQYDLPFAGSNSFDDYLDLVRAGDPQTALEQTTACAVG